MAAKPVPRESWSALFEGLGGRPHRTAPRVEMLDGFNSGWIDFERIGTEQIRGIRTLEEVLRDLIQKAG